MQYNTKKSNLKQTKSTVQNITVSLPSIVNKGVFMKAYEVGRKDNRRNGNDNVNVAKFIDALKHLHAESLHHKKEVKISARGMAAEYQVLTKSIENPNNIIQNKGSFAVNGNSPERGKPGGQFREKQEKIIALRKELKENEKMLQKLQNQKVMQQAQQHNVNYYNVPAKKQEPKNKVAEMQKKQLHNLQAVNRNEVYNNYYQQSREASKPHLYQAHRHDELSQQLKGFNYKHQQHHNDNAYGGMNDTQLRRAYQHDELSSQLKDFHYAKLQHTPAQNTYNQIAKPTIHGVNPRRQNDSSNMQMTFGGGTSNMQSTYNRDFSPPKAKERRYQHQGVTPSTFYNR